MDADAISGFSGQAYHARGAMWTITLGVSLICLSPPAPVWRYAKGHDQLDVDIAFNFASSRS
jgi:hypothetical protein